jgi:LPS-assembly protein
MPPVRIKQLISVGIFPFVMLSPDMVRAQDLTRTPAAPVITDIKPPENGQEVAFSADQLNFDSDADIVTAEGNVHMIREGNRLRANKVVWNRKTGDVSAIGNVAVVNPDGDTIYGDTVMLKDTLKDGVIENLLLVLADGGRLAARHGLRENQITTLSDAAYTPCSVVDSKGCPKEPVWKISAVRVVHNPAKHRIYYKGARISLLGAPLIPLPGLSHPDGSGGAGSGLLVPDIGYSRTNGFETTTPFYMAIAPNRDLTLTPHLYSEVLPALQAEYRALSDTGAYRVGGMLTYSSRQSASTSSATNGDRTIRGYVDINGRFQTDPLWTLSGSILAATDKTFMRRYDISDADRLRSTLSAERITPNSYLSIAGWATQTLRIDDNQKMQPLALPAIDYRRKIDDPLLDGRIELQANSLALLRTEGQDTQRAFLGIRWDLRRLTKLGQEVTFTLYGRGDVYHTDETDKTSTLIYRGNEGWNGRAIGSASIDVRWPLVGALMGGIQRISPRVQLVASPRIANLRVPNEDARSVDLEDSNLFALNRFPGYDRWEDSSRVTYGLEWAFQRPRLSIDSVIGQSYRLTKRPTILPEGTGLSGRFSDIVGRAAIRFGDFVSLTERFRLDKDNGSIRRNEINATVGTSKTYAVVSYLRLNRDIDPTIEDLRDREEVQLAARIQFARYWSLFGSTVIDLTDRNEDPVSSADGYAPVRHRLELLYADECIEVGISWRRDYGQFGDARQGNRYLFRLALKNLGG